MRIVLFAILLFVLNVLDAQELRAIRFVDGESNLPVSNVIVAGNNEILDVSNDSGECYIASNHVLVTCQRLGYFDTTLNLRSFNGDDIRLRKNVIELLPVNIEGNYSPKDHLFRLLNKESERSGLKDTSLYYSFEVLTYSINDTTGPEKSSGIVRYDYSCCRRNPFPKNKTELCELYGTEDSTKNLIKYLNKKWVFDENILVKRKYKSYLKDYKIEKIFDCNDTIVFKTIISKHKNRFFGFSNDRLIYYKYYFNYGSEGASYKNDKIITFNIDLEILFSSDKKNIPQKIESVRRYKTANDNCVFIEKAIFTREETMLK